MAKYWGTPPFFTQNDSEWPEMDFKHNFKKSNIWSEGPPLLVVAKLTDSGTNFIIKNFIVSPLISCFNFQFIECVAFLPKLQAIACKSFDSFVLLLFIIVKQFVILI